MIAGCGTPEGSTPTETEAESHGDRATTSRENSEKSTPTETETPTATEEPYNGSRYTDEIETRVDVFVYNMLDARYVESSDHFEVRYQSATDSQSEIMAEVAEVIGTATYMVDHAKAARDWKCRMYYNVEGELTFFAEYTISVDHVQEYIAGVMSEDELLRRTIASMKFRGE